MIRKNCKECGKFYYVEYPSDTKKYCQVECSYASRKNGKHVKCHECGKEIYRSQSDLRRHDVHFCSDKCHRTKRKIKGNCKNCDNDFLMWPYEKKDGRVFCSKYCKYDFGRVTNNCRNCGKEFTKQKNQVGWGNGGTYCSRKCFQIDMKNGNIKKRQPLYPKTKHLRNRINDNKSARKRVKNLSDTYIKNIYRHTSGIYDVPKELIELKRLNIKRKRIIRNHNQKS